MGGGGEDSIWSRRLCRQKRQTQQIAARERARKREREIAA